IAGYFPGYCNSEAAHGIFNIDTTRFSNGLHTIAWYAADNAGHADGIGSRFITIQNAGQTPPATRGGGNQGSIRAMRLKDLETMPKGSLTGLQIKKGVGRNTDFRKIETAKHNAPSRNQHNVSSRTMTPPAVHTRELESVKIRLGGVCDGGYLVVGDRLLELPVGSSLNLERGIFSWQPGPGFVGRYHLVFVTRDAQGKRIKTPITINISPKFQ
ncbi:MAG: hypothetical protein GY765_40445, partial [bacterium]|nr:hypothetical protein [bacterium]